MRDKRVYFLGIGGIGMSALAYYFLDQGWQVGGYDLTPSPVTDQLLARGVEVSFSDDPSLLPEGIDFVVYTPAIPRNHSLYRYFMRQGIPLRKRAEVLGEITREHPCIAVSGTHGKTTTSALLAHLLHPERKIMAFIGGMAKNLQSNFITQKDFETIVVEADEYDRSFLQLYPTTAIITSLDADHLDVYGGGEQLEETFQLFAGQIQAGGSLVIHEAVAGKISHPRAVTYGLERSSEYSADRIEIFPNRLRFDLHTPEATLPGVELGVGGRHNLLNAIAAIAAIDQEYRRRNVPPDIRRLASKLAGFQGVKRRFDYNVFRDDFIHIDDYAHHPAEITAAITAVRQIFPDRPISVIFQPHLYSRTRDFAPQFAQSLALADEVVLLDIYPAREEPIEGVSSAWLLSLIPSRRKQLLSKNEILPWIQERNPGLLLTLGAGDIDRLVADIKSLSF